MRTDRSFLQKPGIRVLALVLVLCLTVSLVPAARAKTVEDDILDHLEEILKLQPGRSCMVGSYRVLLEDHRGDLAVLRLSNTKPVVTIGTGVVDTEHRKMVLPFQCEQAFLLPEEQILFTEQGKTFYGDRRGNRTPMPFEGELVGVDDGGYVTLLRYLDVTPVELQQVNPKPQPVPKLAVLDPEGAMVVDFILDAVWPEAIAFRDGYAIVQTGATRWFRGSQYTENNAKTGLMDRSGRFVLQPVYGGIRRLEHGKFRCSRGGSTVDLTPGSDLPTPSAWAEREVQEAAAGGLVAPCLQRDYGQPTTRADFCDLAVSLYETVTGAPIQDRTIFRDNCRIAVEKAAAVGITRGVGDGRFDPDGLLTREQAATMLARLAEILDGQPAALPGKPDYADSSAISPWAVEAVARMQAAEIMQGVGRGLFAPRSPYTKEQSIATILRLYQTLLPDSEAHTEGQK